MAAQDDERQSGQGELAGVRTQNGGMRWEINHNLPAATGGKRRGSDTGEDTTSYRQLGRTWRGRGFKASN